MPDYLSFHPAVTEVCLRRVSPFRYPRFNACLRLPGAFRSLPRLSSASSALASTLCPYLLDLLPETSLLSACCAPSLPRCFRRAFTPSRYAFLATGIFFHASLCSFQGAPGRGLPGHGLRLSPRDPSKRYRTEKFYTVFSPDALGFPLRFLIFFPRAAPSTLSGFRRAASTSGQGSPSGSPRSLERR